jgi:hypothetical protein
MGNTAETSIEIDDSESEAEELHAALDIQQEPKESARDTGKSGDEIALMVDVY